MFNQFTEKHDTKIIEIHVLVVCCLIVTIKVVIHCKAQHSNKVSFLMSSFYLELFVNENGVYCKLCPPPRPLPLGEGGYLDLLWFPITQMCVSVCQSIRPHPSACVLCQTLFTRYFLQFFTNGFQIHRYADHGQDLELISCSCLWLNFHGHKGSLCFKMNFVYVIFLVVL